MIFAVDHPLCDVWNILIGVQDFCWPKFINQLGQKSAFGRFLSCVGINFCFFCHFQVKNYLYWHFKYKKSLIILGQNFCIPATVYRHPCQYIQCQMWISLFDFLSSSSHTVQWLARPLGKRTILGSRLDGYPNSFEFRHFKVWRNF